MENKFIPKFEFMEEAWTLDDNRVQHGPVIAMSIKGNRKGFIESSSYTILCHGTGASLTKPDHLLFKTKEDLLNSL